MALRTMAPVFLRRADDDKAFERLYERYVRDVYRYAAAMLGEAADAEDVTQTTFLNAYRAFKSGTRPQKPQSWLIAIAHNVCRQRFRQAQRRPHEVAFDERVGDGDVREEVGAPTAEDLRRALSQLPPNQRAALVMRELEGGSYAEIAKVLGVSVSALETLLFRARRALREQLDEQITCQQAAFAINKQIDGRLSLAEKRALRAHLRACAECNSLAQSQRAQRRALKALVLVPLPATMSHWMGNQAAAAATGTAGAGGLTAVGATTVGGAAGTSSVVFGGVAAKVAAVVVAGAAIGGGTYQGVTRVVQPATGNAQPPAARVEFAATAPRSIAADASRSAFETPSLAGPILVEPSPRANPRAIRIVRAARSVAHRVRVVPHRQGATAGGQSATAPGQTAAALAHTPPSLRSTRPGVAVKATRAAAAATARPQAGARRSSGETTAQSRRRTPSHPARPSTTRVKPKPRPVRPTPPILTHGRRAIETLPDDPAPEPAP